METPWVKVNGESVVSPGVFIEANLQKVREMRSKNIGWVKIIAEMREFSGLEIEFGQVYARLIKKYGVGRKKEEVQMAPSAEGSKSAFIRKSFQRISLLRADDTKWDKISMLLSNDFGETISSDHINLIYNRMLRRQKRESERGLGKKEKVSPPVMTKEEKEAPKKKHGKFLVPSLVYLYITEAKKNKFCRGKAIYVKKCGQEYCIISKPKQDIAKMKEKMELKKQIKALKAKLESI